MARHEKISEEDIKRYIAKKAMKVAKKLKSEAKLRYNSEFNSFGDPNLNETFVWRKKIERDVAQGRVTLDEITVKAEKKRRNEATHEIEKLKKRRVEREVEKARREEEVMMIERERANIEAHNSEKNEKEKSVEQMKIKSRIRLCEGRPKPIDVFVGIIDKFHELNMELDEPYMVFKGLTVKELEELHDDIMSMSGSDHAEYWEALRVVCEWELNSADLLVLGKTGVHSSIEPGVKNFFDGKNHRELVALQDQIDSEMRSGKARVVEFWEIVLRRLHFYKAKAYLKKVCGKTMQNHSHQGHIEEEITQDKDQNLETDYDQNGSVTPQNLYSEEDNNNKEAIDPQEDELLLKKKLMAVVASRLHARIQPENYDDSNLKGVLEEGDAVLGSSAEVILPSHQSYNNSWHDKYHPRKPKYFNHVHTGYEWNKYNRTHYDNDNPPPKFVQGYKFTIFYPHLIDKTVTPTCCIEKDGDSSETCILRFQAAPPYQDIAFRIVNSGDWEKSKKKGFKYTFERGILHLYFNFKRYSYRK